MTGPKPPSEGSGPQNEKWYELTRHQILLFAVGIALFVLVGGLILDWYIEPKTSGQKKDLVQALGLLTAGVAGAVGIYFTWRGQRLAREAQEHNQRNTQEQLWYAQEESRLTRQGQITERFTRAIDQLRDDSLEVRLGGIYALERIARESKEDYWPIMEVLTAYVRQHAPWPPAEGQQGEEDAAGKKSEERLWLVTQSETTEVPAPDPDIQAIMTVLRRRTRYYHRGKSERLDLRKTNLSGARLSKANFSGARLSGANLLVENLSEADLSEVDLRGARLRGADLSGALYLTQDRLQQAFGNENTKLPPDLKPPANWGVKTEEQTAGD